MKTLPARPRLLIAAAAALLHGCVYAPAPMQASYPFTQHPGVALEVWWQYDAYGVGYKVSSLVNRSGTDKCAWTDALGSRLLRAGETWPLGAGAVNVGVSNVQPWDPNCVNAKGDAYAPVR